MRTHLRRFGVVMTFIAVLCLSAGCGSQSGSGGTGTTEPEDSHPTEGPHKGSLAELGDSGDHHAELVIDQEKKEATVYVLDGDAKKAKPIDRKELTLTLTKENPPVQIKLAAKPLDGETKGSSRFVGTHDKLKDKIDPDTISVSGKIDGNPVEGTFGHDH